MQAAGRRGGKKSVRFALLLTVGIYDMTDREKYERDSSSEETDIVPPFQTFVYKFHLEWRRPHCVIVAHELGPKKTFHAIRSATYLVFCVWPFMLPQNGTKPCQSELISTSLPAGQDPSLQ